MDSLKKEKEVLLCFLGFGCYLMLDSIEFCQMLFVYRLKISCVFAPVVYFHPIIT
jgi:hypothetical protein